MSCSMFNPHSIISQANISFALVCPPDLGELASASVSLLGFNEGHAQYFKI